MTASKIYLFKRPNGFWYILYTVDGRIKWKSTRCTNRGGALKKLVEFREFFKKKVGTTLISHFIQDFLEYAGTTYAKASVDIFKVALRNLQTISGDCSLSSISPKHVDTYKAQRLQAVAPTSVNVELRALRTIFNIALRWNLIETNPFARVQLVRVPEVMPAFFSKNDFHRFLAAVGDHPLRDVFLFAFLTGLRRGEILNLKWADINLEERIAQIQSSVTYHVKAGRRRAIPLSDEVVKLLERRRRASESELVFGANGRRIKGNYVSKKFKGFVRVAGLSESLHFHSCRHTTATWMVQSHVSIYEVQKLLGHSDISTTQIYSHLLSSELHDAVNKISVNLD